MNYAVFKGVEVVSGKTGTQSLVLDFKPPALNSIVHPIGMQRKERCSRATGMLACDTLPAIPALPTFTVLEETLKADLVASNQTLTTSSLTPSVISSFLHFCSFDLTTGSHLSLHSHFFSRIQLPFLVTYHLHLLSSFHWEHFSKSPSWMPFIPQPGTAYQ